MEDYRFLNNCHEDQNGELFLWNNIKDKVNTIFDVGARDGEYYFQKIRPEQSFHLFEPHPVFFQNMTNKTKYFPNVHPNNVGIGEYVGILPYYEKAQSFVNRFNESPSKTLPVISLKMYLEDKEDIESIDFLKIDTEGYELDVLRGLGNKLQIVKNIQFEYGGTYPDRNILLSDVYNILKDYTIFIIGPDGLYSRPQPIEHLQYSNYFATRNINDIKHIIKE